MNDPKITSPVSNAAGFSTRIHSSPDDVIIDYLKDIRDQLATLNRSLNALIELDYGANIKGIKVVPK